MPASTEEGQRGVIRKVLPFLAIAFISFIVSATYFWFVSPPVQSAGAVPPADAVVVFVGAEERIDTAVDLMERGAAESLVIPNGRSADMEEDLCEDSQFQVFCPDTETIDTRGEARVIGDLAAQQGWSSLIAVTSRYHVHRATYMLGTCFDGSVTAVTPEAEFDADDWTDKVLHEWAGTIAAMTIQRAC